MNVLVNAKVLNYPMTGVQRYLSEILARLPQGAVRQVRPSSVFKGPLGHVWEQAVLPGLVRRGEVLWSPSNTGPVLVRRQVVTVHDLATLEVPEEFSRGFRWYYNTLQLRLLPKVAGILTVSEYSKRQIVQRFGVPEHKVVVTPLGVDSTRFKPRTPAELAEVRARLGLPEKYVLFVGTFSRRKNVQLLVKAWAEVVKDLPENVGLVLAGGGGQAGVFNANTLNMLAPRVQLVGRLSETDLPLVVAGAAVFVFPSIFEGFGLPPLEAMACGVPVIASHATSLPEVVGEAGLLIDPTRVDDLGLALRQVLLGDQEQVKQLKRQGLARAAGFNWDVTARRTWEALQSFGQRVGA